MDKQSRITRALELNGRMNTSEIAEYSGIPANEVEEILKGMEDIGEVFAFSDVDWKLNQ